MPRKTLPWNELGGGSVALLRVSWNLTREQLNNLFSLFKIEEPSSSKTLRRNKVNAVECLLIPWINKNPGFIFLKEQEVAERTPTPNERSKKRRMLKEQVITLHENFFRSKSKPRNPQAESSLQESEDTSGSGSDSAEQLQAEQHDGVDEGSEESEEDKHANCIISKDDQCWSYYGFKGCELGLMKLIKCDEEGNVVERRPLDPSLFYCYEDGNRVVASSTDAKVANVDIDLDDPSAYLQFVSKIFDTDYMQYLIASSEEKRL